MLEEALGAVGSITVPTITVPTITVPGSIYGMLNRVVNILLEILELIAGS